MKRSKAFIFHNGLLLVGAAITLGLANPGNAEAQNSCSTATLTGNYIYAQDGYQDSVSKPFAQAGRETFDGKGNMSGVFSGNFNGTIVRGDYAGTYTVNPDCSGSVTFTDNLNQTSHFDIYVADNGNEFVFVQTDQNSITAAYERRRVSQ
jgi:hypothetical protein